MLQTLPNEQPEIEASPRRSLFAHNLPLEVMRTARNLPDKRAIGNKRVGTYRWYTYRELLRSTMGFTGSLRRLGMKAGDRVAILSRNRPEWILADLGIMSAGGTTVPFYDTLSSKTLRFLLQDCGAKGLVLSNDQQLRKVLPYLDELSSLEFIISFDKILSAESPKLHLFSQVVQDGLRNSREETFFEGLQDIGIEDVATVIYTSGTTSVPKGVQLTHRNILSNVECCQRLLPVEDNDTALSYLPLAHVMERMSHMFYLMRGLTVVHSLGQDRLMDELREVNPHFLVCVPRFFEKIHSRVVKNLETSLPGLRHVVNYSVTLRQDPPVFDGFRNDGLLRVLGSKVVNMLADKLVLERVRAIFGHNLKFLISGGAPLDKEIGEFFEGIGVTILEGYGLTETAPVISLNTMEDNRYGTVGKPLPGVEVRISTVGEILVKGPNVMKGYLNRDRENDEAFTRDGWFRTGDIGYIDNEGFLVITDRLKNIIVLSTGKNVSPQPVEDLYRQSPYIAEVVIVGDNQKFLTALILPQREALAHYAAEHSLVYRDYGALVKRQEIHHLIEAELRRLGEELAPFERVKKFVLLAEEFTQPGGALTPTLKVKRDYLVQKHQQEIALMYLTEKNVSDIYL